MSSFLLVSPPSSSQLRSHYSLLVADREAWDATVALELFYPCLVILARIVRPKRTSKPRIKKLESEIDERFLMHCAYANTF